MTPKNRAVILFAAGLLLIVLDVGQIWWAIHSSIPWIAVAGTALLVFASWICWLNLQIWRRLS